MMNSYSIVESINRKVNASVTYKTDLQQYGKPEHWCLPTDFGDCEDYALAKRQALLQRGWPNDRLGLVVCKTETGEGHCVLLVMTDKGNYILDNRYEWPMLPNDLPYKWESMLCAGKCTALRGFSS